jgi:5-methylthioribose kinase
MHLDAQKPAELQSYLQAQNWLAEHETILAVEKPGEGNMNYTLRIKTNQNRSFIVKQARPYVEKYPQIAAPAERATVEGIFYKTIAANETVRHFMPQLLGLDAQNHVLALEDLGMASDFTFLYQPHQTLSIADAEQLAQYIRTLHDFSEIQSTLPNPFLANREMRALNHEHIFNYPFMEENGFDLDSVTPGLQMISMGYKIDAALKKKAADLGKIYLSDGDFLLHGDYYPGSWLRTDKGVKIIDPEFCFYGPAEFDLGVMTAHLMMAKQSEDTIKVVYESYGKVQNPALVDNFTGIEIMRRLIGLAQLPLALSLLDKEELLEQAYELIMAH